MAMNKAEKECVEQLEIQLALQHTEQVRPDMSSIRLTGTAYGFSQGSANVTWHLPAKAVTSSVSHGKFTEGSTRPLKTDTQGGIPMHSTRLNALRHTRNNLEQSAAEALRKIDLEIAKELANPTPTPTGA
jgi:hypothetical protein